MKIVLMACLLIAGSVSAREVSFNQDIRTILADRCFSCHGPDSASRKADLRLDLEDQAKAPLGDEGIIPIVPGDPEHSAILQRMLSDDPDEVMPPPKSKMTVSKKEVALLRKWISEGAKWEKHWAFIPPEIQPAKSPRDHPWPRNPIDEYILARLNAEKLKPAPAADPAQLLRRVSFDLTGLPPTLAALDAFLNDPSDAAYAGAVDRLLRAPAFGERMALEWLDVARYGDTDGLFEDHARKIYPWRDWLVNAFNHNLPYDQFITWQLAGDLLPEASIAQKTATGFLRNNTTSNEGGIIDEDYRIKYLVDRVNTTSTAFLGLTMECSQCHDHKFDPMTQKEYFQFAGFFNSLVGKGNTKGATAPVLKMLPPEKEARLAAVVEEMKSIDEALKSSPPELLSDFEQWLLDLEQPVAWRAPEIVSRTGDAPKKNSTTSATVSELKGQFVRLAKPAGQTGFLTISEVEVYAGGKNVARAGTAKQSTVAYQSPGAKAIDGNNNGTFKSCSCTAEAADGWWEVDLGSEVAIDHVLVYNRNDCCPERLDQVKVQVLNAQREMQAERNLGDAPYRSVLTFNPDAPEPIPQKQAFELVLTVEGEITALQLSSATPGLVESLKLQVIGKGKPRDLKVEGAAKLKVNPKAPAIVALDKPFELAEGEQLKIILQGHDAEVEVTADDTAVDRAKIPKGREQQLAHFRKSWSGFAEQRVQREALVKEQAAIDKTAVVTMIASDEAKMRPTYVLMRGEYDKKGDEVQTAPPESIMGFADDGARNRLGLAQWLTDPQHPLTARVAVNRYWQMIFGTGIVRTSEDFGTQGDRPSHQELLDYLAVDFMKSGWDVKRLMKQLVLSTTYRQSSVQAPELAERDPANRLLSHASRQRLPAEFIRDHALSVSGLLVQQVGGPGVQPYQPAELFGKNAIGSAGAKFTLGKDDDLYRRSLYTYWKRQIPAANMRILGADGRTACRTRRERTNTPLQALVLLNDPQFVEAARVLGERMLKEGGATPAARLGFAFRLATSREASAKELAILQAELDDRWREFKAAPETATAYLAGGGVRKPDAARDPAELAAYAAVAALILNLDESISKS